MMCADEICGQSLLLAEVQELFDPLILGGRRATQTQVHISPASRITLPQVVAANEADDDCFHR